MVFHRALGAEGVLVSNPGDVTAVVVDDVIDGRPLVVDLDHDGVSCGLQHNPVHAIQRRRVWWVSLNHTHTGLLAIFTFNCGLFIPIFGLKIL